MWMKLFLLALVGLVALAAAQEEEFLVIDDEVEKNDIDPDSLEKLESDGTVKGVLKELLSQDSAGSLREACINDRPAAYEDALKSRGAIFDESSGTNQAEEKLSSSALSRNARQVTSLYHCRHQNYLLRWFALFSGSTVTDICFVPYANRQAITYARCIQPICRLNSPRNGRCRPSCYIRRRILVICYNFRLRQWRWRWVVRSLPQACRCSTC